MLGSRNKEERECTVLSHVIRKKPTPSENILTAILNWKNPKYVPGFSPSLPGPECRCSTTCATTTATWHYTTWWNRIDFRSSGLWRDLPTPRSAWFAISCSTCWRRRTVRWRRTRPSSSSTGSTRRRSSRRSTTSDPELSPSRSFPFSRSGTFLCFAMAPREKS